MAALAALAAAKPFDHSLTPFYDGCALNFWRDRLEAPDYRLGFYYLPSARILFTPFALAGPVVGGIAWRWLAGGLIALAGWRWARLLAPDQAPRATSLILILLIAPSAGALHNGQFDGPTWALMALGAAAVAEGRWWSAAAILALALALKPTAIVAVLMLGALWPAVGLRLVPLIAVVLAVPFVNPDWTYVIRLYHDWLDGLTGALPQSSGRFNDLADALAHFGLSVSYRAMTLARLAAALGVFAAGLIAVRRLPRPRAAFAVLTLATLYLLLFNPRTEGSGYVGLALVAAPLAARMLLAEQRPLLGGLIAALAVAPGLIGVSSLTLDLFNVWLNPLLAVVFLATVFVRRASDDAAWAPAAPPYSDQRS